MISAPQCVVWRGTVPGAETQGEWGRDCPCSLPSLRRCQFIRVRWLGLERCSWRGLMWKGHGEGITLEQSGSGVWGTALAPVRDPEQIPLPSGHLFFHLGNEWIALWSERFFSALIYEWRRWALCSKDGSFSQSKVGVLSRGHITVAFTARAFCTEQEDRVAEVMEYSFFFLRVRVMLVLDPLGDMSEDWGLFSSDDCSFSIMHG